MADTTVTLKTSGMHCRSCSALVDMTVGDLDGVSDAKTVLETGETVVTFDSDVVTVEAIIDAVRGAGYDAEVAA